METINYNKEEKLIAESIMYARKVQEYIWQELSYTRERYIFNTNHWVRAFQKRVDKIQSIDTNHASYKVELRKRLLQQAALSIAALQILDNER